MSRFERGSSLNTGYRSWFSSYRIQERGEFYIFILDYETSSMYEDDYDTVNYDSSERVQSKRINGILVYFLDEHKQKRKAFLRHDPYFYLLVENNLKGSQVNKIIVQIKSIGEYKVIKVEKRYNYDAADLTFLQKRLFIKVTVNHPSSVPDLRKKCELIKGVLEWREADVLFHHRAAIDHNVRVGYWYKAEIRNGEIQRLELEKNRAPPDLKIVAFDIETVFEQTREPNPERDAITMVSLFTGDENLLLVNSEEVETKDIRDIEIVLRQSDNEHSKPWVDWLYSNEANDYSNIIEHFPLKVVITENEEELLRFFYTFLYENKPEVIADFFGGQFDIPFLEVRSAKYGISWEKETGFKIKYKRLKGRTDTKVKARYSPGNIDYVEGAGVIHLDAYLFNEKYSYLPKKDLGLKPSVQKKLKIIPIGREALFAIKEDPANAAGYAGCDGYITWKYVREIVLDFFISMGQMFPVPASELLARRAGSLDDLLIDAEGFKNNIVAKRRIESELVNTFSSKINIESLAYTGGLVEARRPGIWRSDLFYNYDVNKNALQELKRDLAEIIKKETKKQFKKFIKAEFDRRFLHEIGESSSLGDLDVLHDPVRILEELETEFLRNGIPKRVKDERLTKIQGILEDLSNFKPSGVNQVIENVISKIDQLSNFSGDHQLLGVHVDVTSMYPSQIRQYKLQPSAIVSLSRCGRCDLYERDNSCFIEKDWVIKLSAHRPCRFRKEGSKKCNPSSCSVKDEAKCKRYEPIHDNISRSQEIFTHKEGKTEAYVIKSGKMIKVPINKTYLGSSINKDPYLVLQSWVRKSIEGAQITCTLNKNHFDIFEDQSKAMKLPDNMFMSVDVRTKKITVLLSVYSRVCQKSFDFVSRIMDEFFTTRVRHKVEARRLASVIAQRKENNLPLSPELTRQQKFHDSTQLGMKVPLNSIYGLLGMKAGVRNASTPCAGITTKLSADLIHWAADELEKIGMVTELDTDGIWLWVPKEFPLEFPVEIVNSVDPSKNYKSKISLIDKILNEKVRHVARNDNFWKNDGHNITRSSKCLIGFEQDGPYDFQFVMGKKKYVVYNYDRESKTWEEKEVTGLESKRADFSKLQKYFQEKIINAYLDNFCTDSNLTLKQLYQNAIKVSDEIQEQITQGKIDPSYLVKPKAINKALGEYKSKLPQVFAAKILSDLGFSVDPGTRIEMLSIKGDRVIPKQIFDFNFETVKKILMKHGIATLSFSIGKFNSVDDVKELIDVNQYIRDIFAPGRIFDRMVKLPMEIQQATIDGQLELSLGGLTVNPNYSAEKIAEKRKIEVEDREKIAKKKEVRVKKHTNKKKQKKSKQKKQIGLDTLFFSADQKKITKKRSHKNKKTVKTVSLVATSSISGSTVIDAKSDSNEPLTTIEMEELVSDELFDNGKKDNRGPEIIPEELEMEEMFCSECGSLLNGNDLTGSGCPYCKGRK
ncbi:MAG: 3'-5' exonuclease [Candidatus Hodarchaeales archaeon]